MAMNPIGVSFLPSEDNQAQGLQRGKMEGDLGQALKILTLQLPTVRGARPITPYSNLGNAGAAGLQSPASGFNPNSAVFEAVIKALSGMGSPDPYAPASGAPYAPSSPSPYQPSGSLPAPNIIPGIDGGTGGQSRLDQAPDTVTADFAPTEISNYTPQPGGYQGYNPDSPFYGNAGGGQSGQSPLGQSPITGSSAPLSHAELVRRRSQR